MIRRLRSIRSSVVTARVWAPALVAVCACLGAASVGCGRSDNGDLHGNAREVEAGSASVTTLQPGDKTDAQVTQSYYDAGRGIAPQVSGDGTADDTKKLAQRGGAGGTAGTGGTGGTTGGAGTGTGSGGSGSTGAGGTPTGGTGTGGSGNGTGGTGTGGTGTGTGGTGTGGAGAGGTGAGGTGTGTGGTGTGSTGGGTGGGSGGGR